MLYNLLINDCKKTMFKLILIFFHPYERLLIYFLIIFFSKRKDGNFCLNTFLDSEVTKNY